MLTLDQFKDRTTLPDTYVDEMENARPGWMAAQINLVTAWVNARLCKRYAVPFVDPAPEIVLGWVTALVTMRVWSRRGYDPNSPDMVEVLADLKLAKDEIKEAADSEVGLFELPLRSDTDVVGVTKGGPWSYTEASPYVWTSRQACTGRDEDSDGYGSET